MDFSCLMLLQGKCIFFLQRQNLKSRNDQSFEILFYLKSLSPFLTWGKIYSELTF